MISIPNRLNVALNSSQVTLIATALVALALGVTLLSMPQTIQVICRVPISTLTNVSKRITFVRGWLSITTFSISATLASGFVAGFSYALSRLVPRTKVVAQSVAIILVFMTSICSMVSMVTILIEGVRTEALETGLERAAEFYRDAHYPAVFSECEAAISGTWYLVCMLFFALLLFSIAAARALRIDLEQEGHPATVYDLARNAFQTVRNIYYYGHAGMVTTSDYVRKRILSRDTLIMARQRGDTLWREVAIPTAQRDYAGVNSIIKNAFNLPPEFVLSIVKNSEILIEHDDDVARLRGGDKLEFDIVSTMSRSGSFDNSHRGGDDINLDETQENNVDRHSVDLGSAAGLIHGGSTQRRTSHEGIF